MKIVLEWFATAITLTGALLTSLAIDPWNIYVLNFGSFLWLLWAVLEKKFSIALVNFGMLAIYIFGIFRRIF